MPPTFTSCDCGLQRNATRRTRRDLREYGTAGQRTSSIEGGELGVGLWPLRQFHSRQVRRQERIGHFLQTASSQAPHAEFIGVIETMRAVFIVMNVQQPIRVPIIDSHSGPAMKLEHAFLRRLVLRENTPQAR